MGFNMNRREFISGVVAAGLLPSSANSMVGYSASPELIRAFRSVPGIIEGLGGGTLHVLFAPWCPVTPLFYNESREVVASGRLTLNWIPSSGGQPEGSLAIENLLRNPDAHNIPSTFTSIRSGTAKGNTPLADAQDKRIVEVLEPAIIRDSGMGMKSPTFAYAMGESVRLLPGGIYKKELELIARAASA